MERSTMGEAGSSRISPPGDFGGAAGARQIAWADGCKRAGDARQEAEVPPELAGERVDRAAAALFAGFSRAALNRCIRQGALKLNGEAVQPDKRLKGGERLSLAEGAAPFAALAGDWARPQPVGFALVHEEEHFLVVNKPAGVVVHPGAGQRDGTLVNGLLHRRPSLAALPRAGIVHRLDKNTSGLLLVAASAAARSRLVAALAQRALFRRYLGVAEGAMIAGRTIDKPIGRHARDRTRQRVRADGRRAVTEVRVKERFRAHSFFQAVLETGRTHQIRVHMASIGHPLVGDRRYGARGRLPRAPHPEALRMIRSFARQALHAAELAFDHPMTGKRCSFVAPLPRDMAELTAALRQDLESHA